MQRAMDCQLIDFVHLFSFPIRPEISMPAVEITSYIYNSQAHIYIIYTYVLYSMAVMRILQIYFNISVSELGSTVNVCVLTIIDTDFKKWQLTVRKTLKIRNFV